MWFTIGFGVASAFCAYCYVSWIGPAALLCLLVSILFFILLRLKKRLRVFAVLFLGAAVGIGWFALYDSAYLGSARGLDGNSQIVTVDVTDYSYATNYGGAFAGTVTVDGRLYEAVAYLDDFVRLEPGDKVKGEFSFRLTTNGGLEEPLHHQGNGIFLIASQSGRCIVQRYWVMGLMDYPAVWREALVEILEDTLPEDASGFAKALLLGDRSGIDYKTSTAFKVSGISHIIAVSGLHVSILFGLVYLLTGRRRVLTAVIGIPVVIMFAAIAGFTPSITRASLMQIILMISMLAEKEYDPPTSLSFAVLVMLICNPLVITSVSFQLSVGCMAGIFLFGERIRGWLLAPDRLGRWKGKLVYWFASSVSVTLSAMVFTTPLVAMYFGTVSLIGVVTNLLTLWIITYVFYGLMAVCAVGCLSLPVASFLGEVIAWPIRSVLGCAKILAQFPLAAVYTKSIYIVLWLIFAYVLLAAYLCLIKKPAALFAGLIVSGLCLAVTASWIEPLLDECRVTVLDVGQGQSIILQGGGKTFLVDCGGDYDEEAADIAAETLLSQGISRLDGIILTHLDADHAGGVANLLTRIETETLFYPRIDDEYLTDEIAMVGDTVCRVDKDLILSFGDTNLTIFAPVSYNSGNESSICVLFQTENCDILITGDRGMASERILLKQHSLPELEVLVVGHHGSKYSTCEELLAATSPEFAFISVGKDNPYGHPTEEVLLRLLQYGCVIYRTDQNGTIIYRR